MRRSFVTMKSRAAGLLAGVMVASQLWGQQAVFENNSDTTYLTVSPQVAATTFINSALFAVGAATGYSAYDLPFDTLYTLYFTNKSSGRMEGYPGFRLDFSTNTSAAVIERFPAAVIHNQGKIYASTRLELWATNIVSPGSLSVGIEGLLRVVGRNVNLSRSFIRVGGDPEYLETDSTLSLANGYINPRGVTDAYWGVGRDGTLSGSNGTALNLPFLRQLNFATPSAGTPSHQVLQLSPLGRNRLLTNSVSLPSFLGSSYGQYDAFVLSNRVGLTSAVIQAVFIPTNNLAWANGIVPTVRFMGGVGQSAPAVELRATYFDPVAQASRQLTLYLADYSMQLTNFALQTGYDRKAYLADGTLSPTGTRRPNNYELTYEPPLVWSVSTGPNLAYSNVTFYPPGAMTNRATYRYAAYSALINATNDGLGLGRLMPLRYTNPTNATGRLEIQADTLDLRQARIHADNVVSIVASNLVGNTLSSVDAPILKYDIGTTQSVLRISNLVSSAYNRLWGQISVWSAVWSVNYTNQNLAGNWETNELEYHVMFVDFEFYPSIPVDLWELTARATNVVIADAVTASSALKVDAESLTVTGDALRQASLVLPALTAWGPEAFPRLKHLTNDGNILISQAADFSTRLPTNNIYGQPTVVEVPYLNFINRGNLTGASHRVYATNLVNSGTLMASAGGIQLRLTNGTLAGGWMSSRADVDIQAANLTAVGSAMSAGGALLLDVTNSLTDGGPGALNDWSVSGGFTLLRRPRTASLLGTRITSHAAFNTLVRHVWAGRNLGATPAGFTNNAALGQLVLDGADLALFEFAGAGTNDALYVDYLEFRGFATNVATALQIAPNLTIYFANANLSPDKLNGALGGRLQWVYQYTGAFSSTNLVVDGRTITLNAALLQSMFSDLDADGIPNKLDPTPFLSGRDLDFRVAFVRTPALQAQLSWMAIRYSTSLVEYTTNLTSGPWLPLTSITQGAQNGRLTVLDPVRPGAPRYYRVRVEPYIGLIQP
ncbi:MAG: hypothetical protein N3J91_07360 [Verrucomicrobiae bacterium]|nr:hypothetical protein [Verrucomicrobiae bacterium]